MDAASHWKVWLDAHTPEAGRRVTERIAEKLGLELVDFSIEPYPKGGFVAAWTCLHDVPDRNAAIVAVIGHGQKVANGWSLSGSVYDELEGLGRRPPRDRRFVASPVRPGLVTGGGRDRSRRSNTSSSQ